MGSQRFWAIIQGPHGPQYDISGALFPLKGKLTLNGVDDMMPVCFCTSKTSIKCPPHILLFSFIGRRRASGDRSGLSGRLGMREYGK